MEVLRKVALSTLTVFALAYLLPGVTVTNFGSALLVAIIIEVLRAFVKPILVILTLPITIFTFGLFLLVINACIILLADSLLGSFSVNGFWWAVLFSLLLSSVQSCLFALFNDKRTN